MRGLREDVAGARAYTPVPAHLAACLIAAFLFFWAFASAALEGPRVAIRQPGAIASAPADWWILVTVDPRPEHRFLIVIADGQPGEYRRSDYALDGGRAARLRQIWFKALPEGCYWFSAAVADTSAVLASVTSGPVHFIGLAGDPCP